MSNMIKERVCFNCQITVLTGMHIGGNKDSYGIGGVDTPVIKNPVNDRPIIPGSSLKGKVRFLLEMDNQDNKLINDAFGEGKNRENNNDLMFTRILFRDFDLSKKSAETLESKLGKGVYTEIKAENSIDSKTGKAVSPRFIERVPAGSVFNGEIVVQVLNTDNKDELVNLLKHGLELLESSFLGGSGSRGYGQVSVKLEVK